MRTRHLKPGFFKNDKLAELSYETRLLFAGLWTLADRAGRLEDRPKRIDAEIFPYDKGLDVDRMLEELDRKDFIFRYILNGNSYIQIPKWFQHQHPHPEETGSKIPPIPLDLIDFKACREFSRQSREKVLPQSGFHSFTLEPSLFHSFNPASDDAGALAKRESVITVQKIRLAEFWRDGWLKKGKKDAEKAFNKYCTSDAMWEKIHAAELKQRPEMLKRDPEHRPYMSTWLNGERWNDEDDPPTTALATRNGNNGAGLTFAERNAAIRDRLFEERINEIQQTRP